MGWANEQDLSFIIIKTREIFGHQYFLSQKYNVLRKKQPRFDQA